MLAKDSAQFDSISAVAVDFLSGFMQALLGFPTQVSNESFGCFPCLKILPIGFLISLCYTEADTPLLFTDTVHLRQQMERVESGEPHQRKADSRCATLTRSQ